MQRRLATPDGAARESPPSGAEGSICRRTGLGARRPLNVPDGAQTSPNWRPGQAVIGAERTIVAAGAGHCRRRGGRVHLLIGETVKRGAGVQYGPGDLGALRVGPGAGGGARRTRATRATRVRRRPASCSASAATRRRSAPGSRRTSAGCGPPGVAAPPAQPPATSALPGHRHRRGRRRQHPDHRPRAGRPQARRRGPGVNVEVIVPDVPGASVSGVQAADGSTARRHTSRSTRTPPGRSPWCRPPRRR